MGTKEGDALTIQIDHGEYKVTFTCTAESVAVNLQDGRGQSLGSYITKRADVPRVDLLLSGIEAWSRELFEKTLAERGEKFASLQE